MITGILGMDRGGTSAVAVVVKALGVHMYGSDHTLDDVEMWGSRADRAEVLDRRLQEHPEGWAWKYPYRPKTEEIPTTTQYIIVGRDPIARAMHNRDFNSATAERFADGVEYLRQLSLVYKWGKPVCYVSYEKLLTETPEMVQVIADFVGKPVTPDAIKVVNHAQGYDSTKKYNEGVLK